MTADLTLDAFLLARIAEDEAAVEWATEQGGLSIGGDEHGYPTIPRSRVLARCAADRHIVELHRPDECWPYAPCSTCAAWDEQEPYESPPTVRWPCATLRHLANVYAEHPDYREEWKP